MSAATELAISHGQGWRQVGELFVAFGLASLVGLERQFRGKSAGLRTQTIVGTASALIFITSKYGFGDVVAPGLVTLDPSRVAAQIVSGIGFLGAGLIIRKRGAIRGLTTAAAVWETAAIGMAAGAGLPLLAAVVTALHFVIVLGYTPLGNVISARGHSESTYAVTYLDGQGVLRTLLSTCTVQSWKVDALAITGSGLAGQLVEAQPEQRLVSVELTLTGAGASMAAGALGGVPGVVRVDTAGDEEE